MSELLLVILFISLSLIAHTYLLYPFIMIWLFKSKTQKVATPNLDQQVPVTILIAAFNEEKVIRQKILSVLNSHYPQHLITVLVGSDASSDQTDKIVTELSATYANVRLIRVEDRAGKTNVLNQLQGMVQDELLILTDANVLFNPDTINFLIAPFKDPEIGLVAAHIIKTSEKNEGISLQEKKYLSIENQIKSAESTAWGIMMGAEGGCFAIRKNLFSRIPDRFIVDDFYITLQVITQGKKTIFCDEALCYEDVSGDAAGEFRRKVRISSGNFQNLYFFRKHLFPIWKPLAFSFWSHKVLRWLTPFLLLLILLCSSLLTFIYPVFAGITVMQIILLLLPLLNYYFKFNSKILRFISHFYLMNFALLSGFFRYSKGIQSSVWQPVNRNV